MWVRGVEVGSAFDEEIGTVSSSMTRSWSATMRPTGSPSTAKVLRTPWVTSVTRWRTDAANRCPLVEVTGSWRASFCCRHAGSGVGGRELDHGKHWRQPNEVVPFSGSQINRRAAPVGALLEGRTRTMCSVQRAHRRCCTRPVSSQGWRRGAAKAHQVRQPGTCRPFTAACSACPRRGCVEWIAMIDSFDKDMNVSSH